MIVKASDVIRTAFLAVPQANPILQDPWTPVIVTEGGPRRLSIRCPDNSNAFAEDAKDLVPEWLADAMAEGSVIVMPMEDFLALDEQVREHLEVISL